MTVPPAASTHSSAKSAARPLSLRRIVAIWWPLAISWLLMTFEGPAHSAVVARLPRAEANLAAWGGIVFPLLLIIEAPIIMLLTASTALSRDWASYTKLYRFMMWVGALLTGLHVLIAFTPLYDVVARTLIGAPAATIEPGRLGLRIMTPWTWAIAYRRFQQGAMIRFEHSRAVGVGTILRLLANAAVLTLGYTLRWRGMVVASAAVATGVVTEAIYAGVRVRPIVRTQIRPAPAIEEPLTLKRFSAFYLPLILTATMNMLIQPIGSAAMSRMPRALASLAAWPIIHGLIFMMRSFGIAYNEVVVALLEEPGAFAQLRRFAGLLALITTLALLLLLVTPLADLWLRDVMALPAHLLDLGRGALWIALLMPAINVFQSWYQGMMVYSEDTHSVSASVGLYLLIISAVLGGGVVLQQLPGLTVTFIAFEIAGVIQVAWMWRRTRAIRRELSAGQSTSQKSAD